MRIVVFISGLGHFIGQCDVKIRQLVIRLPAIAQALHGR